MPAPIEFYFDFSSPYGYLASCAIDDITAKYGRQTIWRPILLGVVFKLTAVQPFFSLPLKGDYARRDMERSARLMNVPYKMPSVFPIATLAPSRVFYWLADKDPERAKALARAYYRSFFVDDIDISNSENTISVAVRFGLERAQVSAALGDARVKARLKSEVDAAIAKGVFGSPFFLVNGEPFWGADRLNQVERWLETGGW